MQLIKPTTLSLISKTYRFRGQDRLAVGGVCLFRLARTDAELNVLLPEAQYLAVCHEALGKIVFDLGIDKVQPEFLAAGSACAPSGETRTQMPVAITLAGLAKRLDVYGNQQRRQGLFFDSRSAPEPFAMLPLTYATAYGGKDHAQNPAGGGRNLARALPNVVYAGHKRHKANAAPASFTAQGIDWPGKLGLAGTYDAAWQRSDAPGYPRDIDWRYFNLAAEDQRFAGPLEGGASYRIEGMHPELPVIEGRLPDVKVRIFASEDPGGEQGFRELATVIDTVWFFPDRNLGLMIHRGVTDVRDSEAQDIGALLLAYENAADTPRAAAAYRAVMKLRTGRDTALAAAFNESQLLPVKSALQQQALAASREAYRAQAQASLAQDRDALLADIAARFGLQEPLTALAATTPEQDLAKQPSEALRKLAALPDPSLLITPQELKSGDFDLTELLEVIDAINTQTQALATEARQRAADSLEQAASIKNQLLKDLAGIAAPATLAAELDKLQHKARARAGLRITGVADLSRIDAVLAGMTPAADATAGLVDATTGTLDGSNMDALKQAIDLSGERALRLARLKAPEYCRQDAAAGPHKKALGAFLRAVFLDLLNTGAPLSGRDFAGIDLSGLDLGGLDLSEVMLEQADLSRCRFTEANLYGAVLTGATVDAADFSGADLRNGNLSALTGSGARFDGCRLDTAVLMHLQLPDSSWRGSTLRDNTLLLCELPRAVFAGAQFEQVTLLKCNLAGGDFSEARLRKLNGTQSCFRHGRFARSSWESASLLDADFTQADFADATLRRCIALGDSCYRGCNFAGVMAIETGWRKLDMTAACFHTATFSKSDFGGSTLRGADLREACFYGSLLSGADCRDTAAADADFYRATLRKADFTGSALERANLREADLFETVFRDCRLRDIKTDLPLKELSHA